MSVNMMRAREVLEAATACGIDVASIAADLRAALLRACREPAATGYQPDSRDWLLAIGVRDVVSVRGRTSWAVSLEMVVGQVLLLLAGPRETRLEVCPALALVAVLEQRQAAAEVAV